MTDLLQQVVLGLASGSIFASLALAVVLIHRATGIVNFAQGEMATFTTYLAWALYDRGWSYWPMFLTTVVLAFLLGVGVHRIVIRPVERASPLVIVMVTLGLFAVFNGACGWIWDTQQKAFPSPFSTESFDLWGVRVSRLDLGVMVTCLACVALITVLFRYTRLGLAMRAAALAPAFARLMGVRVSWMLALGWGLAAVLGAVAGMMSAPVLQLDPNMMQAVLLYALAAAVLGGLDSPLGAVVGGLLLGVTLNVVDFYVGAVTPELRLPLGLALLLGVLFVRPSGIFGGPAVRRA